MKFSLSKLQNGLDLKTAECNDLHSCLGLQKEAFEKQMKVAFEEICDLETQLHDFEQKHGDIQEELLLTKKRQTHISDANIRADLVCNFHVRESGKSRGSFSDSGFQAALTF